MLAVFVAALIAVPIGILIGLLTIRLGNLYVALVTLSFGLLAETLVFTRNVFYQDGLGVAINRPDFLSGDRAYSYFCLAVFIVLSIIVVNLRRSTTGLALAAVRYSEPASRTLGQSAGLEVVMDRCMKIEHARFAGGLHWAGFDTGVISSRRRRGLPTS